MSVYAAKSRPHIKHQVCSKWLWLCYILWRKKTTVMCCFIWFQRNVNISFANHLFNIVFFYIIYICGYFSATVVSGGNGARPPGNKKASTTSNKPPTAKRPRTCGLCHEPGHTRVTCPQGRWKIKKRFLQFLYNEKYKCKLNQSYHMFNYFWVYNKL